MAAAPFSRFAGGPQGDTQHVFASPIHVCTSKEIGPQRKRPKIRSRFIFSHNPPTPKTRAIYFFIHGAPFPFGHALLASAASASAAGDAGDAHAHRQIVRQSSCLALACLLACHESQQKIFGQDFVVTLD